MGLRVLSFGRKRRIRPYLQSAKASHYMGVEFVLYDNGAFNQLFSCSVQLVCFCISLNTMW